MGKIYLVVAVVSLIVGLVAHNNDIIDGIGKALFGVFFILFLITTLFGKDEPVSDLKPTAGAGPKHK